MGGAYTMAHKEGHNLTLYREWIRGSVGNVFENCMTGVVLGGGRDNTVLSNHCVDTDLAVHLDNRGMNWQQQVRARVAAIWKSQLSFYCCYWFT
jgi:hypothetical protein